MDFTARSLGIAIREERVSEGISLRDLAYRTDISAITLGEIEHGERMPGADVFYRIVTGFNGSVTADELFEKAMKIHKDSNV